MTLLNIPFLLVRQLHGATDVGQLSKATIPTMKFCDVKKKIILYKRP